MITPIPESYWVVESQMLAGEYPGSYTDEITRRRLDRLVQGGISMFIDLTQPGEMQPYEPILHQLAYEYDRPIHHVRFPIPDFGVPTHQQMERILEAIDKELETGRAIYLHCRGGIGRTGTVVGCHLVRRGMTGEQALEEIARLRIGAPNGFYRSPESDKQWEFVMNWSEL
jgi:protein-tyrosine phosphatase